MTTPSERCIGERILSVRQLVQRYGRYITLSPTNQGVRLTPFFAMDHMAPGVVEPKVYNHYSTYARYFVPLYTRVRGSTRYLLSSSDMNGITVTDNYNDGTTDHPDAACQLRLKSSTIDSKVPMQVRAPYASNTPWITPSEDIQYPSYGKVTGLTEAYHAAADDVQMAGCLFTAMLLIPAFGMANVDYPV